MMADNMADKISNNMFQLKIDPNLAMLIFYCMSLSWMLEPW